MRPGDRQARALGPDRFAVELRWVFTGGKNAEVVRAGVHPQLVAHGHRLRHLAQRRLELGDTTVEGNYAGYYGAGGFVEDSEVILSGVSFTCDHQRCY